MVALGASAELDHRTACSCSCVLVRVVNEGMSGSRGSSTGISNADSVTAQRGGTRGGARFADLTQTGDRRPDHRERRAAQLWARAGAAHAWRAALFVAQNSMSSIDGDAPSVIALGGLQVGQDACPAALTVAAPALAPRAAQGGSPAPAGDLGQAADSDVGGLACQ
jgi:hypothetical protein